VGATGVSGVGVTNTQVVDDSLFITLSNNQVINAGKVNNLSQVNDSSNGINSINGSYLISTIGSLQSWIVPTGVNKVEIFISGTFGGNGGYVFDVYGNRRAIGGIGGSCGVISFIINVNANDTIKVYIGQNGSDGANSGPITGGVGQGGSGSQGQASFIYINDIQLIEIIGGSGAGGGYAVYDSGQRSDGSNGSKGYVNPTSFINSGILNHQSFDTFGLGCNRVLIRY
jgi:hypothetical protein